MIEEKEGNLTPSEEQTVNAAEALESGENLKSENIVNEESKVNEVDELTAAAKAESLKKENPAKACPPAEPAEAEREQAAHGCGKFKSVEALLKAYNSLEAEFTRRSQRLKELEESKAQPSPRAQGEEELLALAMGSEKVKSAIVADYLQAVFAKKSVPFTVGGAACAAPKSAPRSVKEAGALANTFLKN